jgi:hypothetical protein
MTTPLSKVALPPPRKITVQISYKLFACIFFVPIGLRAIPDRGSSPTPVHIYAIITIATFIQMYLDNCTKYILARRIIVDYTRSLGLESREPETFKESLSGLLCCIRFHDFISLNSRVKSF